jgi:hypothetical protein
MHSYDGHSLHSKGPTNGNAHPPSQPVKHHFRIVELSLSSLEFRASHLILFFDV